MQLQISIDLLAYIYDLYASLFSSLDPGSTPFLKHIQCILTHASRNSGLNLSPNLNGRGPLIDFIHQTALLLFWLLPPPNALHQPISFVLVKIMFHSLIWVVFWLSILPPL